MRAFYTKTSTCIDHQITMHYFIHAVILILILWQPTVYGLSPFEAKYYIAFGFVNLGEAQMKFKQGSKNNYELGFYAQTSGFTALVYPYSLEERSKLERLDDGSLRSTGYFYEEKKEDTIKKQYRVSINAKQKKVSSIGLHKNKQWALNTQLATDKLSFAFILGDDIEQGKELRSPITIIDGKKVRLIHIKELTDNPNRHSSRDDSSSPFQREDYKNYKRFFLEDEGESMEIWLSKRQRHIPHKILFTSDGWTLYYELSKIHWLN